jgi:REP element-mobilizing transposase RayT
VAEIAKVIKANTSRFINTQTDSKYRFAWQEGYGAFSCSYSMLETVKSYIENQAEHHKNQDYKAEFQSLAIKHNIEVPS